MTSLDNLTELNLNYENQNQPIEQSQESPDIVPQNSIQNRNCFFTIDSSSSDNFDEDNVQTPIIRQPRLRGPNINQ